MSFYIVISGHVTSHRFDYIDEKESISLYKPIASRSATQNRARFYAHRKLGEVYAIDIMSKSVVSLTPDDFVKKAEAVMSKYNIHHLPVLIDDKIHGLVSRRDLSCDLGDVRLSSVMSPIVLAASEGTLLRHLALVFINEDINSLPIIDSENNLKGIVTHRDLIHWLLENKKFQKY